MDSLKFSPIHHPHNKIKAKSRVECLSSRDTTIPSEGHSHFYTCTKFLTLSGVFSPQKRSRQVWNKETTQRPNVIPM